MLKLLTGPVFHVPGSGSSWNLFFIRLGMGELPHPSCVEAQERYEQSRMRLALLLIGGPIYAAFYALVPDGWFIGIIPALLSTLIVHVPPIARWWELRGTALTIALAVKHYGADLEAYEDSKVSARMGYDQFKGWSRERIKAAFVGLRPWAEKNGEAWL